MPSKPKAFSYLRFSTPEQALGDSKRRQVEAARAWAVSQGLELDEELTDEGVSGFRGANIRADSALGSFLTAIREGLVPSGSVFIVESLDRLSRDKILRAQRLFLEILEGGVTIVTLMDGRTYSEEAVNANPMDLLISLTIMIRANEESETKARRLRAVWDRKRKDALEGIRVTKVAPDWLQATDGGGFAPIPERAAVVQRIYEETLRGDGQHRIAERLTAEGVPTWGRGRVWHRTYVRKLLDNPATKGTAVFFETERLPGGGLHRKEVQRVEGYYPAVIDSETWSRVCARLGSKAMPLPGRGKNAGRPLKNLLGGLARCPICGSTMTRVSKGPGGGRKRLVCTLAKGGGNCTYHAVAIEDVETAIYEKREELVFSAPATTEREASLTNELRGFDLQLEAIAEEREELAVARRERRWTPAMREREAQLYAELAELSDSQKRIEQLLADAASPIVSLRLDRLLTMLEQGPREDLTETNGAMREAFTSVIVDYREGFLLFNWRHGGQSSLVFASPFSVSPGGGRRLSSSEGRTKGQSGHG